MCSSSHPTPFLPAPSRPCVARAVEGARHTSCVWRRGETLRSRLSEGEVQLLDALARSVLAVAVVAGGGDDAIATTRTRMLGGKALPAEGALPRPSFLQGGARSRDTIH